MYDTLCDVLRHHRPVQAITQAWQQCDDIRQHMLYFLENHDEQRLASDFVMGDGWKALPALVVAALLQQNPFMLYAGQEWGERGMDAEGFSGRDGRTTIFDYWALQPERENALADYYRRVMHIAKNEPAVVKGESFDLMYVNQHLSRQYAFLRKAKGQLLLVVANFDDLPVSVNLNIPAHAFDYLTMAEGDYQGHDLLSDADCQFSLQRDAAVGISLQPRQSVVLSLQQR